MSKEWIVLLAFVSVVNSGNAQLLRSISPKIAYSSSYHDFDYRDAIQVDWKRRSGISAAVALEWFNHPVFSVLTQFEYIQRGVSSKFILTSASSPEGIGYVDKAGRVDYFSVPVLLKFSPARESIIPYVLVGGRIDHILRKRSDDNFLSPVYDKFAKTIYGLSFGLGWSIPLLTEMPFTCEMRYNFDLKNSYHTEFLTIRNNSIDVWLGVAFST